MKEYVSPLVIGCMVFFIAIFAMIPGCTTQTPASGQANTTTQLSGNTISPADISDLALQSSEIPANYTLVEKRARSSSEVSQWALDHGWMKGYSVLYVKNSQNSSSGTIIRQNISFYPGENASLAVSDTLDGLSDWVLNESNSTLTLEKITLPAVGEKSGALRYSNKSDNSGMYVISFAKSGVFLDIETNGTQADFEIARQIANVTAAKIR